MSTEYVEHVKQAVWDKFMFCRHRSLSCAQMHMILLGLRDPGPASLSACFLVAWISCRDIDGDLGRPRPNGTPVQAPHMHRHSSNGLVLVSTCRGVRPRSTCWEPNLRALLSSSLSFSHGLSFPVTQHVYVCGGQCTGYNGNASGEFPNMCPQKK